MARRFAKFLGIVLNPAVPGAVVGFITAITYEGGLTLRLLSVAALVGALTVVLPMGVLLLAVWLGRTDDPWGDRRATRVYLYPPIGAGLVASCGVFTWIYPFPLARMMVVVAGIVMLLLFAANRITKVSIHCAGNAGVGVATGWVYGAWGLPFLVLVPLVAWARITTRHHTRVQTVAGTAIGALGTCACLFAWRYMGLP